MNQARTRQQIRDAVDDQIKALSDDGATLTAAQFNQLNPGPRPDCGSPLTIDRRDATTFGEGPQRYLPGLIGCSAKCIPGASDPFSG